MASTEEVANRAYGHFGIAALGYCILCNIGVRRCLRYVPEPYVIVFERFDIEGCESAASGSDFDYFKGAFMLRYVG